MIERIYNRVAPALKAYVAALIPGLLVIASRVVDAALVEVDPTIAGVVIVILTAFGVYMAPNTPPAESTDNEAVDAEEV